MIVKMKVLEIPQKSMFEGIIPIWLQTPLGDIIKSLCNYILVISALVCNGSSGHFQKDVIIFVTYLYMSSCPHTV